MFKTILGINWRTSLAGWGVLLAAVGRIGIAWKTKDFESIVNDGQLIATTLMGIAAGLGLIKSKDQNVTGTGTGAKSVDSEGEITNRAGTVIGQQPPPDAGKV